MESKRENTVVEKRETLVSVERVAELLSCSKRHVYRLSDSGRMPGPVRLGGLVRWSRPAIDEWIAAGCPEESGSR